jgi:hypothetical protein
LTPPVPELVLVLPLEPRWELQPCHVLCPGHSPLLLVLGLVPPCHAL